MRKDPAFIAMETIMTNVMANDSFANSRRAFLNTGSQKNHTVFCRIADGLILPKLYRLAIAQTWGQSYTLEFMDEQNSVFHRIPMNLQTNEYFSENTEAEYASWQNREPTNQTNTFTFRFVSHDAPLETQPTTEASSDTESQGQYDAQIIYQVLLNTTSQSNPVDIYPVSTGYYLYVLGNSTENTLYITTYVDQNGGSITLTYDDCTTTIGDIQNPGDASQDYLAEMYIGDGYPIPYVKVSGENGVIFTYAGDSASSSQTGGVYTDTDNAPTISIYNGGSPPTSLVLPEGYCEYYMYFTLNSQMGDTGNDIGYAPLT
jgi:hypothetical protein